MLYYIKHEIIGDLVQHISDGVHVRFVIKKNQNTTIALKKKERNDASIFDPSLLDLFTKHHALTYVLHTVLNSCMRNVFVHPGTCNRTRNDS